MAAQFLNIRKPTNYIFYNIIGVQFIVCELHHNWKKKPTLMSTREVYLRIRAKTILKVTCYSENYNNMYTEVTKKAITPWKVSIIRGGTGLLSLQKSKLMSISSEDLKALSRFIEFLDLDLVPERETHTWVNDSITSIKSNF